MEKTNIQPTLIIDLGSASKKAIRNLKNGKGSLVAEVEQKVDQARSALSDADKNKAVIPVVVIYRKKARKRGPKSLPFSPLNPFSLLRC